MPLAIGSWKICVGGEHFVDDLVVAPDHRNHSIGAMLMTEARSFAERSGCGHMRLCRSLSRHKARRFYEANGMGRFSLQFIASMES